MKLAHSAGIAVAVGLFLMPAACAKRAASPDVVFVTKYTPIEFTFPEGWRPNKEVNSYDFSCFSKNGQMFTGVFAFKKEDLARNATPTDKLNEQIESVKSERTGFEIRDPLAKSEQGDLLIATVTYTGEKDSSKNCYRFTLIEFKSDPSRYAVVIQVGRSGDWNNAKPILEKITNSAKPLKEQS